MKRKKLSIKEISNKFGNPVPKTREYSGINIFFNYSPDCVFVDDKTWNDLDMSQVFEFIDRTTSKTGEQFFYNYLRKNISKKTRKSFNSKVKYYLEHQNSCYKNISILNKYNLTTSYTLPSLLYETQHYRLPKWVTFLGFLVILVGILSIFFKSILLVFIGLGFVNTFLHYYFKHKINVFYHDFINLKSFHQTYYRLLKNDNEIDKLSEQDIQKLKAVSKKCRYLTMNIEFADEFTASFYYLVELIKGWFLIDVMQFNSTFKLIKNHTSLLKKVYCHIGLIDAAICVASLKKAKQGCEPTITKNHVLSIKNAYHPSIKGCVENSILIDSQNVIITGGNMSGKTTFLKTIGINVILSQTINHSFSKELHIPELQIVTSIVNEDDLANGKSFFMNELSRAKHIFDAVESSKQKYLILIDEIFKGTNSFDRVSLGASILSSLNNFDCFVIVTTHDLAIIDLLKEKYKTYYFDHKIINRKIDFDYKIRPGVQNNSNVIELIYSMGFSENIISNSKKIKSIIKSNQKNP